MAKPKPKRGPLSICRASSLISQVVLKHRSIEATLEVRTLSGDVLLTQQLHEPPASHQLLGDGCTVLLTELTAFDPDDGENAHYTLRLLDMKTGDSQPIGRASSFHVATAANRVARFRGPGLTVSDLQGADIFSVKMPYDDEHHCLAFLPDGRLAVSTGAGADMALADVAILNADTGAVEERHESLVTTSDNSFAPGVIALDPHGKFMALAGHYSGLVIFDLASGANVADRFAPHPLDLADGHVATHDHHRYADITFNDAGRYLAAACHPGWVDLWTRNGEVALREQPFLNPKGDRLIAFKGSDLVYLDTMGDTVRFALPCDGL